MNERERFEQLAAAFQSAGRLQFTRPQAAEFVRAFAQRTEPQQADRCKHGVRFPHECKDCLYEPQQSAEPVACPFGCTTQEEHDAHDNNTVVSVPHPMLEPTHVCKDCGAGWRQCDDFSFNLRSEKACPACDNTPVGGQLVSITAPLIREVNTLRQSLRAYRVLRLAIGAMMAPLGYHGTISARDDRVQAVMDALAQLDEVDR